MLARTEKQAARLRPIMADPRYVEVQATLTRFLNEMSAAQAEIDQLNRRHWLDSQQLDTAAEAIERAERMLNGEAVDLHDTGSRRRELQQKIDTLAPAVRKQREKLERVIGELSVEAGRHVQAEHRASLARLFEAGRELIQAASAEQAIRNDLLERGYEITDLTPPPQFATPLIIGSEEWVASPIAHYARQLKQMGIEP